MNDHVTIRQWISRRRLRAAVDRSLGAKVPKAVFDEAEAYARRKMAFQNEALGLDRGDEYLELLIPDVIREMALAARYENQIRRMQVDVLVPVPVHPSRKRARGFNQAEVLAVCLGKRLGIPVEPGMLIRDKKTKPQKELSAADRLKNLSGAFRAGTIPEGIKTVLLVDDIYTTGSTVEACARALRSAGVSRVYFVVICMTGGR